MAAFTTDYAELPGLRMAFRQHGTGRPLILLHGNSGSKAMFSAYQRRHFADYRTYALDSRGHGQSQSQDEALSIGQLADDVIAFCRVRGIEEADLIGYSDGGNIALFLAHRAPQLFTKLVAISPNTLYSGLTDDSQRMLQTVGSVLRALEGLGLRRARIRWDLMLGDIGISTEELRAIRTCVRIVYAEHDMIQHEHIEEIAALIPGASTRMIAGTTHLNVSSSGEAIADMRTWLRA